MTLRPRLWTSSIAAWIFAGSVEPARLIASAMASAACMLRPEVSSRSRPVLALYISLILNVVEPGLPMSQALRFISPCPMSAIAGTKDGSEKPESSPSTIGGR